MPVNPQSFTLGGLRDALSQAQSATIESQTIEVVFNTDTNFQHQYTLEDISDIEDFKEERDETEEMALERLRRGWINPDSGRTQNRWETQVMNEVRNDLDVDLPSEVLEWLETKDQIEDFKQVVRKTEETYERVDGGRARSIGRTMNQVSDSINSYENNIDAVNTNLDFEDNMDLDEEGDVFEEDRQRTTGDITWVNENGQRVRTLVQSTGVQFQIGGPDGISVDFDDKKEAKEYYKENRLA